MSDRNGLTLEQLAQRLVANRAKADPAQNDGPDGPTLEPLLLNGEPPGQPTPTGEGMVTIRAGTVVLQVQNLTIVVNPQVALNPVIRLEPNITVTAADVTVNVPEPPEQQIVINVPEQEPPTVNLPELRPIIQVRPAAPAIAKEVKFELNDEGVPVKAVVSEVNR